MPMVTTVGVDSVFDTTTNWLCCTTVIAVAASLKMMGYGRFPWHVILLDSTLAIELPSSRIGELEKETPAVVAVPARLPVLVKMRLPLTRNKLPPLREMFDDNE